MLNNFSLSLRILSIMINLMRNKNKIRIRNKKGIGLFGSEYLLNMKLNTHIYYYSQIHQGNIIIPFMYASVK